MSRTANLSPDAPFQFEEIPNRPSFSDLSGSRFGHLRIVGYSGRKGHNHLWAVVCDCGGRTYALGSNLTRGNTRSCGCLHSAVTKAVKTVHGMDGSPENIAYHSMIARCRRPGNNRHYERGVTVCERWTAGENGLSGFECFFADMGRRPSPDHSVERNDNSGDYTPGNCRWATRQEQNSNTTRNRYLVYRGQRITLQDAARIAGLGHTTVRARLERGWSVEAAIETPT